MKRRQLLKTIAAGGTATVGVGTAAGKRGTFRTSVQDFGVIHVVGDDEIVRTIEDPTWDDVRRLESGLDDSQQLVSPRGDCIVFCCDDCPWDCDQCACDCTSSCCDPDWNTCGCD